MKWDETVVQTDSRCIVCASYHLCFSAVQWCLVCWPADNSYIIKKKKTNQTLPSSGMKMRCGWKFLDWSHWSVNCHPQTAINCSCQLYCSWEMRGLSFFFIAILPGDAFKYTEPQVSGCDMKKKKNTSSCSKCTLCSRLKQRRTMLCGTFTSVVVALVAPVVGALWLFYE